MTRWFAWYQAAFLFGAAAGGWLFGWLGDRLGRTRAIGAGVLCYSLFTLACYFARSADTMLALRFLACLGVGGVWPNAVALVAEAWPNASRPFLAGLLGAAANVGFVLLGVIGYCFPITQDAWRWALLVAATPGGARAARSCALVAGIAAVARRAARRKRRGAGRRVAAARGAAAAAAVADGPRRDARGDPGGRVGGERELAGPVDRPRGTSRRAARAASDRPKKPDAAEQGDDADHAVRRGGVRQPARRGRREPARPAAQLLPHQPRGVRGQHVHLLAARPAAPAVPGVHVPARVRRHHVLRVAAAVPAGTVPDAGALDRHRASRSTPGGWSRRSSCCRPGSCSTSSAATTRGSGCGAG